VGIDMFTIAKKELLELLYSPKFIAILLTGLIAIVLAILNGYALYEEELTLYNNNVKEQREDIQNNIQPDLYSSGTVSRRPNILTIFNIGITGTIGREGWFGMAGGSSGYSSAGFDNLDNARLSKNPEASMFGELDVTFIISTLYSLFAFLLSYNMISGERENGTLQQILSNPVKRSTIYIGKLIGGFSSLLIALLIPLLLGLIILTSIFSFSPTPEDWGRLSLLVAGYATTLLLFYLTGLMTSAISRNSFYSFMICLLIWIFSLYIIPRLAMRVATFVSPPITVETLSSQIDTYNKTRWDRGEIIYAEKVNKLKLTEAEYEIQRRDIREEAMSEIETEADIFQDKLLQQFKRSRILHGNKAITYSLISPSANLLDIAGVVTGSGHNESANFQETIRLYGTVIGNYMQTVFAKQQDVTKPEYKSSTEYKPDENGYMRVTILTGDDYEFPGTPYNVKDMPEIAQKEPALAAVIEQSLDNFAVLLLEILLVFSIGFTAFLYYDVRR
jgi:ABC-type transport system involved in multi-copper enzyme maturation permease subunit